MSFLSSVTMTMTLWSLFLMLLSQAQPPPLRSLPCTLNGVSLEGGDLDSTDGGGGLRVDDAEECAYECSRRAPCRFWTFVSIRERGCYLKRVAGTERPMSEAITGWKDAGCVVVAKETGDHGRGPPPLHGLLDNSGCKLENVAFLGRDLPADMNGDGLAVRSFVECRTACRRQKGCSVFTYVSEWELNCFLKEAIGDESEFEGAISGTLEACNALHRGPESSDQTITEIPSRPRLTVRRPIAASVVYPDDIETKEKMSDFCTFENANFLGGDLPMDEGGHGIETSGHNHCDLECQERPACHYWTFVAEWKVNCYLKSRLGEKADFEGATSGTYGDRCNLKADQTASSSPQRLKTPPTSQKYGPNDECMFENSNFLGGGLLPEEGGQGLETADEAECSEECRKRSKCEYWTFVAKWKVNCYLKATLGEMTDFEGGVSGTYGDHCNDLSGDQSGGGEGREDLPDGECRFENTNFLGGGLPAEEGGQGIETESPSKCSEQCRRRPNCHFWTFVGKWKINCYLKSSLGEKSEFEGGESGTYDDYCYQVDGGEGESSPKPSVATKADFSQAASKDGAGCRYSGFNFLGGDLSADDGGGGVETLDVDECRNECGRHKKCRHWTFVSDWKVNCYLKERKGPERAMNNAVSGSILTPCECAYENTNLLGADLPAKHDGLGIVVGSVRACRLKCVNSIYCKHWVFISDWRVNCYLKSDKVTFETKEGFTAGSVGQRCRSGATSLNGDVGTGGQDLDESNFKPFVLTPPADNRKDHCRYNGVNLQGGDLSVSQGGHGVEVADADGCSRECEKTTSCTYWTFVSDWKVNCYLKNSVDEANNKENTISGSIGVSCQESWQSSSSPSTSGSATATSGSSKVPRRPSSQPDNVCFFPQTNLLGGDLPQSEGGDGVEAADANRCAIQCYHRDACKYWVYVEGWKVNCFLKSYFMEEEQLDTATSGSIGLSCS